MLKIAADEGAARAYRVRRVSDRLVEKEKEGKEKNIIVVNYCSLAALYSVARWLLSA
jgi:hypothetical protein